MFCALVGNGGLGRLKMKSHNTGIMQSIVAQQMTIVALFYFDDHIFFRTTNLFKVNQPIAFGMAIA